MCDRVIIMFSFPFWNIHILKLLNQVMNTKLYPDILQESWILGLLGELRLWIGGALTNMAGRWVWVFDVWNTHCSNRRDEIEKTSTAPHTRWAKGRFHHDSERDRSN